MTTVMQELATLHTQFSRGCRKIGYRWAKTASDEAISAITKSFNETGGEVIIPHSSDLLRALDPENTIDIEKFLVSPLALELFVIGVFDFIEVIKDDPDVKAGFFAAAHRMM